MRASCAVLMLMAGCIAGDPVLQVEPAAPRSEDPLRAVIRAEGLAWTPGEVVWFRGRDRVDTEVPGFVPAALTTRHEAWTAELRDDQGRRRARSTVEIGNGLPRIRDLRIAPTFARVDDDLRALFTMFDPDDDPVTARLSWLVDGVEVSGETRLPAWSFAARSRVEVAVVGDDGLEEGPEALSGALYPLEAVPEGGRVAADDASICILDDDGFAWCWGANPQDLLNVESTEPNIPRPRRAAQGLQFREIIGLERMFCGIALDGELWCWGTFSQHPHGNHRFVPRRIDVEGGAPWRGLVGERKPGAISASGLAIELDARHILGVDLDPYELAVYPATAWERVSLRPEFGCGLDEERTAWCWGEELRGRLGVPDLPRGRYDPQRVSVDGPMRAVVASNLHACAIDWDREAWCWGQNVFGQLGSGTGLAEQGPVRVALRRRWLDVRTGADHTCGIDDEGGLYCWGDNVAGRLGDGTRYAREVPTRIASDVRFTALGVGRAVSCAIDVDGDPWCWGAHWVFDPTIGRRWMSAPERFPKER